MIRNPGKITDEIGFLGTRESCLYLLKGEEAMIIGGGMSYVAPTLERQFSAMDFDCAKVKYLVISHSHFDHCGAVPYLKRKFPHIQVLASEHSQEVFSNKKAVRHIAATNSWLVDKLGLQDEYERLNLKFDEIEVDRVVTEEDVIKLGNGIEICFIEVPGHSKCSIAIYVPELKAMFPSDAAPGPMKDENKLTYPSSQCDYFLYKESLKKLAVCEVEICAFEHNGVAVSDQAKSILHQGLRRTEDFKDDIIERYQQIGDLDKLAEEVAIEALEMTGFDLFGVELHTIVAKTVIRTILSQFGVVKYGLS